MPAIKVTSEELHSVSSQLKSGSEEVMQRLSSMKSKVDSLLHSDWAGAASISFKQNYDKWNSGAQQVKQALDGIAQLLGQAAQTYQETEDKLSQQLRG